MALTSPGVQVTVSDQSNYAPAVAGTVPLILIATEENKIAPGGTTYAAGTISDNAGVLQQVTSQRDLTTLFGTPTFKQTTGGAAINASEQNEYGLLAAYSSLGVSNQAYVIRADVDLGSIGGSTVRPYADPVNGTYWFDGSSSKWGIYQWNSTTQAFDHKTPLIIRTSGTNGATVDSNGVATGIDSTVGSPGDYAVAIIDETNPVFYKNDSTWVQVGSDEWHRAHATVTGATVTGTATVANSAVLTLNGSTVTISDGDSLTAVANAIVTASIDNIQATVVNNQLRLTGIYSTGNIRITNDPVDANVTALLTSIGLTTGTYRVPTTASDDFNSVPTWETGNSNSRPSGSVWFKTSATGGGLNLNVKQFNENLATWQTRSASNYANVFAATRGLDRYVGGLSIASGTLFAQTNALGTTPSTAGTYIWTRRATGTTTVSNASATLASTTNLGLSANATVTMQFRANLQDSSLTLTTNTITFTSASTVADFVAQINLNGAGVVTASHAGTTDIPNAPVVLTHVHGGDVIFGGTGAATVFATLGLGLGDDVGGMYANATGSDIVMSNWMPLTATKYTSTDRRIYTDLDSGYQITATKPYVDPVDQAYWYYTNTTRVDIMINTGTAWVGYRNGGTDIRGYALTNTNTEGVIVAASEPIEQNDRTALVPGDLWLDTSDLENYPMLYRYQTVNGVNQWVEIDKTDATTQNGIIFADARWATSANVSAGTDVIPSITDLAVSNYVDLDCPDATQYPRGMLLFNTRASGNNVKRWSEDYFTDINFPDELTAIAAIGNDYRGTWITTSGTDSDGLPNFGRKAQRGTVVAALKAALDSSTQAREEQHQFNLIACPGYPELIPNMVALNEDRDNTAFIIGDAPLRLQGTASAISAWANNSDGAAITGEAGLLTTSPYAAVYYPHCQTTDLEGNSVVQPASHVALRTIIKSDNNSYPWMAPAGTRRGLIDNAGGIGYVDAVTGRFVSIGVTTGLRDQMYTNKINPLTVIPGLGAVVYGQKTLSSTPSSLDRINVARLVNYLRKQLNTLARPFIFEPNDPITRNAITATVNGIMNDLVAKRGIVDYTVVCDNTNNTSDRIARNELWIDVAVQPTKDVEFIYIPIRLQNQDSFTETAGTGA